MKSETDELLQKTIEKEAASLAKPLAPGLEAEQPSVTRRRMPGPLVAKLFILLVRPSPVSMNT